MPLALQNQHNLEEQLVELDHLRTLNIEVNRERAVTKDVQADVEMLRNQLGRANESIDMLTKVRGEQAEHISSLEKVRGEQTVHISQLEKVREK